MSAARSLAAAAALLAAAGCAPAARFVVIEPGGGAVAILRNTPAEREKALALVAGKCPGGYDILREEEYETGKTVSTETSAEYDKITEEVRTTEEHRMRRTTEWRITFTCR